MPAEQATLRAPLLGYPAHLHRKDLPQGEEEGMHLDIWVFAEAVGLGVVLKVHVVPPAGRSPLQRTADVSENPAEDPGSILSPHMAAHNCL